MARSEMFLKATGQRSGEIFGESGDKQFPNLIEVIDWSWAMSSPTAVGGSRTGRTLMEALKIVKRADRASTSLMSVMKTNEILTSAVLSVRKAGGTPLPYFVVTLSQARITSYAVSSGVSPDGAPALMEEISLSFKSISIEYSVQSAQGASQGSSSFMGEVAPD